MSIVVNGQTRTYEQRLSVAQLLEELGLSEELVAVELNRRILRRADFDATSVEDGDKLEVVHFVGGG